MHVRTGRSAVAVCLSVVVAGCGGGGGGGGSSSIGGPPPDPVWQMGNYSPPATYAAYCASPRTGVDPTTQKPYPDRQGSAVWENFWIRSWSYAYYLWYRELPDANPALYTTPSYFQLMKTSSSNPSGTPKDKPNFHFTYPTAQWEALSQSGVSVGYGATWVIVAAAPPRQVYVAYTEAGSPATAAGAGLARGASVTAVDGVDLVNGDTQADVDALNAGLFPVSSGETHTFTVTDPGAAQSRTFSMTSINVTETPVQNTETLATGSGTVGYLTFNDHIATAESELITAISTLQQAGVTDLVLDLRYNGGGYLDIASEVAYMIAGPTATANQTFDLMSFNDKYPTTDPITGQPITPTPFFAVSQGYSGAGGQPLPHLDLPRVFVLTSGNTCSASEAIVNGLRGVGVTVIQIGAQTCGKPYGFYPQDNCGTTYFSIEFKGVNALGFGDYGDGFVPVNTTSTTGVQLPGCSVADDFAHALGDPQEARLMAALGYRQTQTCPAPSGVAPPSPLSVDGNVAKPLWLMNRILRRPH